MAINISQRKLWRNEKLSMKMAVEIWQWQQRKRRIINNEKLINNRGNGSNVNGW
jgi:hypothetical protein